MSPENVVFSTATTEDEKNVIYPQFIEDSNLTVPYLKQQLQNFTQWQRMQFSGKMNIAALIHGRSEYIDLLLKRLWLARHLSNDKTNPLSLIAVGGYGRCELHPFSDIDILILSRDKLTSQQEEQVSELLAFLWDLKLDVGHSVRTIEECLQEANQELTVYTNLLESRLVYGDLSLFEELTEEVTSHKLWPSAVFFAAKCEEQNQRHQRYHSTSYNLEPDIKASPGGLRDIHTLQWIARRHFNAKNLDEMASFGFLTHSEQLEIKECLYFLWRVRFALHSVITRYDNRLLFDRQLAVAQFLGYKGEKNRPIEHMMKDYYRVTRRISELNSLLIQLFDEAILTPDHMPVVSVIDSVFQLKGNLIDLRQEDTFKTKPETILLMFYHLANNENISGIYSATLRHLRSACRHLNEPLCQNSQARLLFMLILAHHKAVSKALVPMHKHGVLTAYMPQWSSIVGLMQFDLFHIYTVDEHTIRVLLNIEKISNSSATSPSSLCNQVYKKLPKKELLLIAALFHDIAKGRGGDHSVLGAQDVTEFAQLHDLSTKDGELLAWLVEHHLLMSITAQRRDIQDINVITQFANEVKTEKRLNYLLCLTVADICATNETLWNSWKQSLLHELYHLTMQYLQRDSQKLPDIREQIRKNQAAAMEILFSEPANIELERTRLKSLWRQWRGDYFLRHSPEQIAWHTRNLLTHNLSESLVLINEQNHRGGTEIFIYSPDRPYLFATVAGELDRKNLNIYDAQIFTNHDGMVMDTFIVLEPNGQPVGSYRHDSIQKALNKVINQPCYQPPKARHPSARLRHFSVPTKVNFIKSQNERRTYLELTSLDRPGLLAQVGEIFAELNLSLHSARISTVGERVEDRFILTDENESALSTEKCLLLQNKLIEKLAVSEKNA